jgi:4-amino-4-deoxy-L-arabinose transferase-like glycosyltransferase
VILAARLFFVLGLLAVCSFAPGFFIVRRFRWNPLEKLCGSVGLSLILLYLAAWAIYVFAPATQPVADFAVSTLCLVLAGARRRDIKTLFGIARVRRALVGFGFLLAWCFLMLAIIRVYSGAGWAFDWLEHFQRSLFFLQRFPVGTSILAGYQLPARPPLMNVLGAFFLGPAGDRFEVYQFVFVFLNLLPFLACCLLLPALAGRRTRLGKRAILPLAAIFAMSPVVMQSATYTWTKALAAFFVILALSFYLAALRKGDSVRMLAAFLALSAGFLTHYSAGPYLVILTLHYLFTGFRRRCLKFKELAVIASLCGSLLFTWFGWSLAVYGTHATLASNTSVTTRQTYTGSYMEKVAGNLFDTLAPGIVRDSGAVHIFEQPNNAGYIRDNVFIVYQTNLIFGMGVLGGPLVVLLLFRLLFRKSAGNPERSFWLMLIPCAVVLGIAVVGERDFSGVAHLTLLPMELLGLTWLAVTFRSRRWAAYLILAGSLLDFPLGVLLHARVENFENGPGQTPYTTLSFVNGRFSTDIPGPDSLSQASWQNWYHKHQYALTREWMTEVDRYAGVAPSAAKVRSALQQANLDDQKIWLGWYSRHGGSVTFVGDAFGNGWVPSATLIAAWLALLWMVWHRIPPAAIPAAAPRARRKKSSVRK